VSATIWGTIESDAGKLVLHPRIASSTLHLVVRPGV